MPAFSSPPSIPFSSPPSFLTSTLTKTNDCNKLSRVLALDCLCPFSLNNFTTAPAATRVRPKGPKTEPNPFATP